MVALESIENQIFSFLGSQNVECIFIFNDIVILRRGDIKQTIYFKMMKLSIGDKL